MANDFPQIVPWDKPQSNRAFFLNFKRTFVDGEPKNDRELPKDNNLFEELETVQFQQAFIRILMNAYMEYRMKRDIDGEEPSAPKGMEISKKDWVAEEDQTSPVAKFFEDYEITDNVKDYVLSSAIREYGLKVAPGTTPMLFIKKFREDNDKQIAINNYVNIKNKAKSIRGKKNSGLVWPAWKNFPPEYASFKQKCQNEHVNLSTSEKEYTDGTNDKGILFCPTFSTLQGIKTSTKSIESLMSEWRTN